MTASFIEIGAKMSLMLDICTVQSAPLRLSYTTILYITHHDLGT